MYPRIRPTGTIKTKRLSKRILKRATGLTCLQPPYVFPITGDAQSRNYERIEAGNGDHTGIVIELPIAIAYIYLYCGVSIFYITLLNQKSHVTSNIFK